jgi:dihydrofolate reductase
VFTFVTDGIESALRQAQTVAGDRDIWVGGGANTVQQFLKAGLLDELQLHIVPIILGGGTSMFGALGEYMQLNKINVTDEPDVTHFTFRFNKS